MPELDKALVALASLTGILKPDTGELNWMWFGKPVDAIKESVPLNRAQLGSFLEALLGVPLGAELKFGPPGALISHDWVPLQPVDSLQVGLAWTRSGGLRLGLVAQGEVASTDLCILARLLGFDGEEIASEVGEVAFVASREMPVLPVSASLRGEIQTETVIDLGVEAKNGDSRTLSSSSGELEWDCIRLVTFVLRAWVREEAQPDGSDVLRRVDRHLFPMLGEPASSIHPLPLFSDMGEPADAGIWANSVLTLEPDPKGALKFLWHARALLTGNEGSDFFSGSVWFPLVPGPASGSPPTDPTQGKTPPSTSSDVMVGIVSDAAGHSLVLTLEQGLPIILASRAKTDGKITRPNVTSSTWEAVNAFLGDKSNLPGLIAVKKSDSAWLLTMCQADGCELHLRVASDQPVGYKLHSPMLEVDDLAPSAGGQRGPKLLGNLASWVLDGLGTTAPAEALVSMVTGILAGEEGDPAGVLRALGSLSLSGLGSSIEVGVAGGAEAPRLVTDLSLGPLDVSPSSELAFHLGKLTLGAAFDLNGAGKSEVKLDLNDLRVNPAGGSTGSGPSGLIALLLPDLHQVDGFSLQAVYQPPPASRFALSGGGKVPIQRVLGPLEIAALRVGVDEDWLTVGVDLSFQLLALRVTAHELGIRYNLKNGDTEPFLNGLGIGFDSGAVRLSGMFGKTSGSGASSDYVGGAVVSVADYFELSAIGGYAQPAGKPASLFIFGSLVAPLGGPPWCFVTGVAGGFGYNRGLPPAGLLTAHPFLKAMSGDNPLDGPTDQALSGLSDTFPVQTGQHWVAAGLQFVSFGFIEGKLVLSLGLGHHFSLNLAGVAAFGLDPIAYFELGFEATADAEHFLMKASVSPSSYFIHPDLFSLRGDFGLGVWYGAAPEAGDFILSIGGYHRHFTKPEHYPTLERVGVKAMYGLLRVSVECYFACTPRALMGGGRLVISGEFGPVAAGLEVAIEVYMRWEPFFIRARLEVGVWFEFGGRFEVSVMLDIHTPPFGGYAVIDVTLVSFEIDFGTQLGVVGPPPLHEFLTRQVGIPAKPRALLSGAEVAPFNTEDSAGLFRVELLTGRASTPEPTTSSAQEGLTTEIPVDPEFMFSVRTNLPIAALGVKGQTGEVVLSGTVDLPLCQMTGCTSDLIVRGTAIEKAPVEQQADFFPAASFGSQVAEAQADNETASEIIGRDGGEDVVRALAEGVLVSYEARTRPDDDTAVLKGRPEEDSEPDAEYPLPQPTPAPVQTGRLHYTLGKVSGERIAQRAARPTRRQRALEELQARRPRPLHVAATTGALQRHEVARRAGSLNLATPPAGAPVIRPPLSPSRPPELFAVGLRVIPMTSPEPSIRRLHGFTPAPGRRRQELTDGHAAGQPFSREVMVDSGRAVALDLSGNDLRTPRLTFAGRQTVRAISLGSDGSLISDDYLSGSSTLVLPPGTQRSVLLGEAFDPALTPRRGGGAPSPRRAIGIESGSVLLALGQSSFAGHGCVLHTHVGLPTARSLLDSASGATALRISSRLRLSFPPVSRGWSLLLRVLPLVPDPGPAVEEVRWLTSGATLDGLTPVIGTDETAFAMAVDAPGRWSLDVDLGLRWRLGAAVVIPRSTREVTGLLRSQSAWDLVDDRFVPAPPGTATTVTLEVG